MFLKNIKIEPYEDNWKDWFLEDHVDEQTLRVKIMFYGRESDFFLVNPKFKRF